MGFDFGAGTEREAICLVPCDGEMAVFIAYWNWLVEIRRFTFCTKSLCLCFPQLYKL